MLKIKYKIISVNEHEEGLSLLKELLNSIDIYNYEIEKNSNGKPYLKNSNIYFSISHSYNCVICAVCDSEIGIDIEKIRDYNSNLNSLFNLKSNNNLLFFKEWTRKEAYIKMLGLSLKDIYNEYHYDKIKTNILEDYIVSISIK